VEGGKTNAEEIVKTTKIKHTKQTEKEQYRKKPKPKNRENKQKQKNNGKRSKKQ
jgi:hypothetical protein